MKAALPSARVDILRAVVGCRKADVGCCYASQRKRPVFYLASRVGLVSNKANPNVGICYSL
jgi:hypothetical protein